jgi:hypothetical protein
VFWKGFGVWSNAQHAWSGRDCGEIDVQWVGFLGLSEWEEGGEGVDVYQVFAAVMHGFKVGAKCVSVGLGTAGWEGDVAYEYN